MLFGQYRNGQANDPDTYVSSVAAILSDYPLDTIRYVTDPRTGIAANPIRDEKGGRKWNGLPDTADVKEACENHYAPIRFAEQFDARAVRQALENAAPAITGPRKTMEQHRAELAEKGILIGGSKAKPEVVVPDAVREKLGISKQDWDKIPNAKLREFDE